MKYVKLPTFCAHCGSLTHNSKTCEKKKLEKYGSYGRWLRAEDKSWNIPEWVEESGVKRSFNVAVREDI